MRLDEHLEKLKYFYEIAKAGSFKKASENIYLTQPSLTKSIKILEENIGKNLFNRLPRGVSLTTEGEILFKYCHHLFAGIGEIEQKLLSPTDPYAGSLRVGTYESIATYFWPSFLKEFLPKYPNLNFELSTGRSSDMQSMLENEELDFIYVVEPRETNNIEVQKIEDDEFNLYASTKKTTIFKTYENASIILMPSALTSHGGLENFINQFSLERKQFFKTSSLESVKELTLAGLGVGLLPRKVASSLIKSKKLKKISLGSFPKKGIGAHSIGIAYHKQIRDSILLKTLIKDLKQFNKKL